MSAIQLSGKALAEHIRADLKRAIQTYTIQGKRTPRLVMILIGEQFASAVYVSNKEKACQQIGIVSEVIHLSTDYSETNLLQLICELNDRVEVDGILVQLPLPHTIDTHKVLDKIDASKDVDGLHPVSLGLLGQKRPYFRACTPYGIMRLLDTLSLSLKGKHAVVVGASNIVGKPMMLELLNAECTVTICHIATKDIAYHIQHADILISAIGKTNVIQSQWIKSGAIVIDAGINRTEEGITGDIDFNTAKEKAAFITPVPGGVGPMTVTMLLENTWKAYRTKMDIMHSDEIKNPII